jgi:uncharacterized protein (DUF1499 family)
MSANSVRRLFRGLLYNDVTTGESAAYPELEPARFAKPAEAVFEQAVAVAEQMPRWRNLNVDRGERTLSCEAVTGLFRFVDDVTVWVSEEAGEAVVKVRSKSRVGKGDLGANAKRIRAFLAALERALS